MTIMEPNTTNATPNSGASMLFVPSGLPETQAADAKPAEAFDLDPARHRTGDVWHVWAEGIRPRPALCLPGGRPVPARGRPSLHQLDTSLVCIPPTTS